MYLQFKLTYSAHLYMCVCVCVSELFMLRTWLEIWNAANVFTQMK